MAVSLPSSVAERLVAQTVLDLCAGGTLANQLTGYQQRATQLTLASQIAEALASGKRFIGEAGTGTGKSLAYLIPAFRLAASLEKPIVVATGNKALQEQIFGKDIPFLQRYLANVEVALMKGMGNYVCLDRIEMARKDPDLESDANFERVLALLKESTFTGDLEHVPFPLPAEIRGRVNGDSDLCAGKHCAFYAQCYIYAMREKVKQAKVIIINHTLLLLDAALDHALLPDHYAVVIDEAHHLEAEATSAFTSVVKPGQIYALLNGSLLKEHTSPELRDTIKALNVLLWQRVEQLPFNADSRLLLVQPMEEAAALASKLDEVLKQLRINRPVNQDEKASVLYNRLLERVETMIQMVRRVFVPDDKDWVYYAEREERPNGRFAYQACMAPLNVAPLLQDKLFDKPMILTSATLATSTATRKGGSPFAYFRERVGLAGEEVMECVLPQAFDYEHQALLYLAPPQVVPEPVSARNEHQRQRQDLYPVYVRAVAEQMGHLVEASRGRAFLLFSSRRMLQDCYALLAPRLSAYPLLRQGEGLGRPQLTSLFQQRPSIL
ncbi:MAG TPA: DEAD/DEAH box helicase, partial [Ktedonobacteraceae bacterium]|nr:DEAD/DEAH box helicase [Ktedonobacteraceae bacterium]